MQKSYIAKSPINFVEFNFRVNAGDILVHELAGHRLTVYRAGEIVKTLKQTSLGIAALVKNHFIVEQITVVAPVPPAIEALKHSLPKIKPDPKPAPKKEEAKKVEPIKPQKEEIEQKRKKAVPTEVNIDDVPRLKEALASRPPLKVEIPEPVVKTEDQTV